MGLLGEIYSAGDSAKRKLKGLLSDPLGELGLLGARAAEDMQTFLDTGAKAYPMLDQRLKPRLDTPQGREMVVDQNVARQKFGEMAANMGMAATTGGAGRVLDYQGLHKPPMKGSGAPLHDLTGGGQLYPDDVYSSNGLRFYGSGDDAIDREAWSLAMRVKDRPNASVTMYRAVPHEPSPAQQLAKVERQMKQYMARRIVPPEWGGSRTAVGDEEGFFKWATQEMERLKSIPETKSPKLKINNGDWVTTSKAYAKQHGKSALGGKYKVISQAVPARKLFTNGDSWAEFGYDESGRALLPMLGLLGAGSAGAAFLLKDGNGVAP